MSVILDEVRTFPQANGPDVRLRIYGDEFYARYENSDGYTVLYDPQPGQYCYGILVNGQLISSGTPVMKRPPRGLRRHVREDRAIRNRKIDRRRNELYPPFSLPAVTACTRGRENSLLPGRNLSRGRIHGLTILVDFDDVRTSIPADAVDAFLNAEIYSGSRNHCSVRQYFLTVSGGRLDYTHTIVGPVTLPHSRAHYIHRPFMEEALAMAAEELQIDFSRFDSLREGVMDAVSFLYAGRSLYAGHLWPHSGHMSRRPERPLRYGGITIDGYMITGLGRHPVDLNIGTICHETGHLLCRFPDLYGSEIHDGNSGSAAGPGSFCLMALGSRLNNGRTPAPVCAFLRDLARWGKREVLLNQPGVFQAEHGDYGTLYRFETHTPNEYFLVENRSRIGLDRFLPSEGLAVYHCDTMNAGRTDGHPPCVLLRASGHPACRGADQHPEDTGELFGKTGGVAVAFDTRPGSGAWDGTETGFNLIDIGEPGKRIRFRTGPAGAMGESAVADQPVLVREIVSDLLIPDDEIRGLRSSMRVEKAGRIQSMYVMVDISHPNLGDLEVTLESPAGETILLHNRDWNVQDDLRAHYDTSGRLMVLKGRPMQGRWTLCVKDLARNDIGRLNRWKMVIHYEPTERTIQSEAVSGLNIPDADWNGITSVIPIDQEGVAREIQVCVDVTHPYIGDLQIVFVAPSGHTVVLMPFGEGGNKVNARRTYDSTNHDGLAALIRSAPQMQGEWTIQVIDCTPGDMGKLEKWSLALTF